MKIKDFVVVFCVFFSLSAPAETVGLYLGGQIWQTDVSGVFGEKNTLTDFNLKKKAQINYFVAVEHPFFLLPNVRISSNTLDTSGKTKLTQDFTFADETFLTDEDVDARFNVSYIDYTLYYQLVDNRLFSFDLGITARDINGDVTVTGATVFDDDDCQEVQVNLCVDYNENGSTTPTGEIETDDIIPMLYLATNIAMPLKRLSVFAQGDISLTDEQSLFDYQIALSYNLDNSYKMDLNMTLGYRFEKMEFEGLDDLYTDIEFKGAFIGMIAHF